MARTVRVAVTGAAGQIGYAILPRLASGSVFGPDTRVILQLLEIPPALPALEGVLMELADCAFPQLDGVVITDRVEEACDGISWALLIGSKPRGKGMQRADLIRENGPIFVGQGQALVRAAPDLRVLVVGNPANTNCLIAMHHGARAGVPRERFHAMTRLDQNRAKAQLADRAGVGVSAVTRMTIWGNHSSTQYPDYEHARIDGKPCSQVIDDAAWLQGEFMDTVQERGAAVIKARGQSSAASAASAAIDHVCSMEAKTADDDWFSAAVVSDGSYGIDEGLVYSFPLRSDGAGGYQVVQGLEFDESGRGRIEATAQELREEKALVEDLL